MAGSKTVLCSGVVSCISYKASHTPGLRSIDNRSVDVAIGKACAGTVGNPADEASDRGVVVAAAGSDRSAQECTVGYLQGNRSHLPDESSGIIACIIGDIRLRGAPGDGCQGIHIADKTTGVASCGSCRLRNGSGTRHVAVADAGPGGTDYACKAADVLAGSGNGGVADGYAAATAVIRARSDVTRTVPARMSAASRVRFLMLP